MQEERKLGWQKLVKKQICAFLKENVYLKHWLNPRTCFWHGVLNSNMEHISLSRIFKFFWAQLSCMCIFPPWNCWKVTMTTPTTGAAWLDCFILRAYLVPGWVSCSRRKDSAEKSGRTATECCCRASVSCLLRFTSPWAHWDPAKNLLGVRSSCSDQPIITTGFMSIRCRKESPKASLCTIPLLSNTELSTWGRQTHKHNTVNKGFHL